jgi:hypothetical protein
MKYGPGGSSVLHLVKLCPWLSTEEVYARAGMKSFVPYSVTAAPRGYLTVAGPDPTCLR